MERSTVFTKTAKGITQVNQRSASLPKDLMKVLKLIDGKSNFGQLMEKAEIDKPALEIALNKLTKDGFTRVFETRKDDLVFDQEEDDFDFTSPKKAHPGTTQRVMAGAANDIGELVRQQERTDADRKAREQAHEAARVKAKAEAEARAKLEAEARAKQEAEAKAMEQAKRAKEASERARAEVEAKQREEEVRRKSLAEQQQRLTVEQKAREEAESRRLAELRQKAEAEAKALAEARARAEAEAAALAKARAEAEAAAKRKAQEATTAESELRARLKEEIEARIRSEMEDLLRNEIEQNARAEMQATIMAEAKLAAKAELEERLRAERETLAKAEKEARERADRDSRARADREAGLRAEAEARAKAETEARIRAETEARLAREEADRRARENAETTARLEAERRENAETTARLEAERRAKMEAEARAAVEAEERERRERELSAQIEVERRAKATIAEDTRSQVEAELEANLEKRAEIEGKAQAKAYMEAKARAELEEEQKLRDEQARKAREIAQILRTKVEPDSEAPETDKPTRRRRRRGNPLKAIAYTIVAIAVIGIGLLHVVPLRPYAVKIERAMSAWLHDDVSIGSVTFRVYPSPHLNVENVAVGKLLDAKAARGRIYMDIATLFGERPSINSIELDDVQISSEAAKRITAWADPEGRGGDGNIDSIVLKGVKVAVRPAVDPFNANLSFTRKGELRQATLASTGGWSATVKPAADGTDIDFQAHNWNLPVGVAVPVTDATVKGKLVDGAFMAPEFEANTLSGKVTGALKITWGAGGQGVHLDSNLALAKVSAQELVSTFTKDIAITGKLDGEFHVVADGASADTLFAAPRVQGRFRLTDGSISNVDLVAVMQSSDAGQRAGVTKFAEVTGEYGAAEHRAAFKQVNLQSGVLRGNGAFELHPNSTLSGRATLEIRSQVAQDRGAFSVSGTVSRPVIRRGG